MVLEINLIKSDFFLKYTPYTAKTLFWSGPFHNVSEMYTIC